MPTATDVDNRPVAIGKWPRLQRGSGRNSLSHHNHNCNSSNHHALKNQHGRRSSGSKTGSGAIHLLESKGVHSFGNQSPGGKHSDWCTLENCVQNCDEESSNICTDVLLHPELLQEFYGDKCLTSANPLLEFCLDGGFSRKFPSEAKADTNASTFLNSAQFPTEPPFEPATLLSHCSTCSDLSDSDRDAFVDTLRVHLRQTGCDINIQDKQGLTALHHLIQGCSKENFELVMESIQLLLSQDSLQSDVFEFKDKDSVLTSLKHLLTDRNLPQESLVKLAQILLVRFSESSDYTNEHSRTLLSYSVFKGDSVLELTRCLLNHGALILPALSEVNRDRSAFTWLVKAIMRNQTLDLHHETLMLLCQNMTEVVGSEVMRSHILTTMIHLGHSASIMAPLFLQLRSLVAVFWNQPMSLSHLCRNSIRHSLGPKNVNLGVEKLNLPPSLTQYLHYHLQ